MYLGYQASLKKAPPATVGLFLWLSGWCAQALSYSGCAVMKVICDSFRGLIVHGAYMLLH